MITLVTVIISMVFLFAVRMAIRRKLHFTQRFRIKSISLKDPRRKFQSTQKGSLQQQQQQRINKQESVSHFHLSFSLHDLSWPEQEFQSENSSPAMVRAGFSLLRNRPSTVAWHGMQYACSGLRNQWKLGSWGLFGISKIVGRLEVVTETGGGKGRKREN